MRLARYLFILAIVLTILAACQPSTPAPVSGAGAAATQPPADLPNANEPAGEPTAAPVSEQLPAPAFPAEPNPLTVSAQPDDASAAETTLPVDGGELTAELNGVRYTLTVPEGALAGDQDIRMIPLAAVDGLPLSGGLLGGVQLEPEGTYFLKPVTLKVELPAGFKPEDVVSFAYQGAGEEFHLYPAAVEGSAVLFEISHFSGYGSGAGTRADVENQAQRQPTSPQDQITQQIADELDKGRRTGSGIPYDKLEELYRQLFETVIYPNLKAAETDEAVFDSAAAGYLNWGREISLLSIIDRLEKEMYKGGKSLDKGLKNAYKKAYEQCVKQNDYNGAGKMLTRMREMALLDGFYGVSAAGYSLQERMPDLKQCMTFTMKFESIISIEMETNLALNTHTAAEVKRQMNDEFLHNGQGTLEGMAYNVEWKNESAELNQYCKSPNEIGDTSMAVIDARIVWKNTTNMSKEQAMKSQIVLPLQPGVTTQNFAFTCSTDSNGGFLTMGNIPLPTWWMGWDTIHKDVKSAWNDAGDVYLIGNFETGAGRLFARLSQSKDGDLQGAKVHEDLTIDIFHTPGQ